MNSIKTNAIYNSVYQVARLIFPIITYPYVSRILGPSGLGQVTYAYSIAEYFAIIALFGLPMYGLREVSRVRNDYDRLSRRFSELLILSVVFSIFATGVYAILPTFSSDFVRNATLHSVFSLSVLMSFSRIDWFFQGMENYSFVTVRSFLVRLISAALVFVVVREPQDFLNYGLLWVAGTALSGIVNLYFARKTVLFRMKGLRPFRHLPLVLPTVGVQLIGTMYSMIDVLMLGYIIKDDAYSVGLYSVAGRIMRLVLSIVNAGLAVAAPRLSNLALTNDHERSSRLVAKSFSMALFFGLPATLGLVITAPQLIPVFAGDLFREAIPTAIILAPQLLLLAVSSVVAFQILYPQKREKILIISSTISLIVAVSLNYLLIPNYGHVGAALATLLSVSLGLALQITAVWKQAKKSILNAINGRIAIVCCLWFGLLFILDIYFGRFSQFTHLVLTTSTGTVLFVILSFGFRVTPALMLFTWLKTSIRRKEKTKAR